VIRISIERLEKHSTLPDFHRVLSEESASRDPNREIFVESVFVDDDDGSSVCWVVRVILSGGLIASGVSFSDRNQ
jgi:hypothetical protein